MGTSGVLVVKKVEVGFQVGVGGFFGWQSWVLTWQSRQGRKGQC